jgi:hypothetical protein
MGQPATGKNRRGRTSPRQAFWKSAPRATSVNASAFE